MGYQADWVGALLAGFVAAMAFLVSKTAFPRLTGVRLYVVAGMLTAACSLGLRELLRHLGI
jgi:hypothetical protein